jgi:hypothetical protein
MLLCLRALVGVMMGGTMSGVVLLMEYLPSNTRGKSVLVLLVFWGVGIFAEDISSLHSQMHFSIVF